MSTDYKRVKHAQRNTETNALANVKTRENRLAADTKRWVSKLEDGTAIREGGAPARFLERFTNLATALAAFGGSTDVHAYLSTTITLTADATIPANVTLERIKGGLINLNGFTLTFTNPYGLVSDRAQVFSGSGAVSGLKYVEPEWFGAAGNGSTDDSLAILRTFNAIRATGSGEVNFALRTHMVAYGFWLPSNSLIRLNGATLKATTTFGQGSIPTNGTTRGMLWIGGSLTSGATMAADYENITVLGGNGILDGNALNQVGTVGVEIPGYSGFGIETTPAPIEANLFRVKNIVVRDLTVTRFVWYGGNIEGPENVLFDNVRFLYSGANGCSVKSGRNITFNRCEASRTRGPNIIDSSYGAGFWHEPNETWQVMENIVHIDCYASYNYMAGFRLWNPGDDAGAEVYAIRCKSYRNSWDTALDAYRSSVDSAGFHVNIPTSYAERYLIEIIDCTALEEYQGGCKIQRGGGLQTQSLIRVKNFTALHCLQDDADGYERAAIAVVGTGVGAPASAARVEIDNATVIAPPTNTAGYLLGVLYTQDVFITNPQLHGPCTLRATYGNVATSRMSSGIPQNSLDFGIDNGSGILGDATKFLKPVRFVVFDQTSAPATSDQLTNELIIWQNDNDVFVGKFKNDDGLLRYVPFLDGLPGAANQLLKATPTSDGWKHSAVTIDESNVMSGVARVNVNGAADNVSTPLSCVGNIGAKSGSINAYGVGGPGETNNERITLIHDGATADIRSLSGGTGTLRTLRLVMNATANLTCQSNGDVTLGRNAIFSSTSRGVDMASGCLIRSGTGSPEGVLTAPVGSIFLRSDGGAATSFYVKESGSGNTGWVAK